MTKILMFGDLKILKQFLTVLLYIEEVLHHAEHKCLTKPARSRKERNFVIRIINKLIY